MPSNTPTTCCKIPVCLEFTGATATDGFKEQVAAIFTELFANACSPTSEEEEES